ncbi:MAG: hypothetical protein KF802_01260 [Bdellovibrionaceae bacterium]|nr:hypothetical protein [Pseudobdellovibrionaceae bacterium]
MARRWLLLLFCCFLPGAALGAESCGSLWGRGPAPTLQDLSLHAPELEAKLRIPHRDVFESLKELIGERLVLRDRSGRSFRYRIEYHRRYIYEDTYYDVWPRRASEPLLYSRKGMLRNRVRYDERPKKGGFEPSYTNFQAKNGPVADQGLQDAVYARNEVRGKKAPTSRWRSKSSTS